MIAVGMFILVLLGALWLLAFARPNAFGWGAYALAAIALLLAAGVPGPLVLVLALALGAGFALLLHPQLRQRWLARPIWRALHDKMPRISATEREAAEAGKVWWEAELFRGDPDWHKLQTLPKAELSERERAFLEGPVQELCAMLNDWNIHEQGAIPEEVWRFLKEHRFFAMIIPERYGGLGFSPWAHASVIQTIATRSVAVAVTVMVPNSLGPAELLLAYGTERQREHWLPRLARGEEIPCFALTSPWAGSDASSIPDTGVLVRRKVGGKEELGFLVSFEKRYITLAPVATVIGLAFHAYDPEGILDRGEDLGITCALVPRTTRGIKIGMQHDPMGVAFPNGPIEGRNVFVPISAVIGEEEGIGRGWAMLMERLSVGRGISLPSLSLAAGRLASFASGAYARLRRQFHLPIARFEGVAERLGRIGGETFLMDATVRMITAGIGAEAKPAIATAMAKRELTERMRIVVNDAMDIHGGRGICRGPSNYLARVYQAVPIGITVEGANILMRDLMIFGQGALRCHPFLGKEMEALIKPEHEGIAALAEILPAHLEHAAHVLAKSLLLGITNGRGAPAPSSHKRAYQRIARLSAALAATSEIAFATLGGALRRREMISGRLAEAWSQLFLASAVLKRAEELGKDPEFAPFVRYALDATLAKAERLLLDAARNFPVRAWRPLLARIIAPIGAREQGVDDETLRAIAKALASDTRARRMLSEFVFAPERADDVLGILALAMRAAMETEEAERRLARAGHAWHTDIPFAEWVQQRVAEGLLSEEEAKKLVDAHALIARAIAVDAFPPKRTRTRKRQGGS